MKKIHVILPVVQTALADNLLKILVRNTVRPKRIIIIDNSGKEYHPPKGVSDNIPTDVYRYNPPKPVNESWKVGFMMTKDADILSVLNDDIIVSKYFFEKILITLNGVKDASTVIPYTRVPSGIRGTRSRSGTPEFPNTSSPLSNKVMPIMFRQGWAFSIRRDVFDKLPPIPDNLTMFCGDDWLFLWSINMGYKWYIMLDNRCFHYTGTSVSKMHFRKRKTLEEKQILLNILSKHPKFKKENLQYIKGVNVGVQPITCL